MNKLLESYYYTLNYRSVMRNNGKVKVFTEKDNIEIESEISFDVEASYKSSINYFAAALIGGIMQSLQFNGKKKGIEIDELESTTEIILENPLSLLNVKGYNEEPKISQCNIKMYIYSDIEEEKLINFCIENLEKCFLYNTLKNTIKFDIKFIPLF